LIPVILNPSVILSKAKDLRAGSVKDLMRFFANSQNDIRGDSSPSLCSRVRMTISALSLQYQTRDIKLTEEKDISPRDKQVRITYNLVKKML